MNHIVISGRLSKQPELKQSSKGTSYLNFDLATTKLDSSTDTGKRTMYVSCVCFGKTAELISRYCDKGDSLFVEGELSIKDYQTEDGKKGYRTSIEVSKIDFGAKKTPSNEQTDSSNVFIQKSEPFPDDAKNFGKTYANIKTDDLPFF